MLNQAERTIASGTIIGICPDFIQKTPLPFSKSQMNNLSTTAEGSYFTGTRIHLNNLYDTTGSASMLYIASHAEADLTEPSNSRIFLSDSCSVCLTDIYNMKSCPPFVVLNACETGLGQVYAEDGVMNFARAFSYSGAVSTITTLWQVDDKASADIMERMYKNLFAGMTKAGALHNAKLEYLKSINSSEAANPFYWAGFVLTGDRATIIIHQKAQNHYFWVIPAIILLIFMGYLYVNNRSRKTFRVIVNQIFRNIFNDE